MSDVELRRATTQDVEPLKEFLDQCFGYHQPESYAIDFAPLFDADSLSNAHLLLHEQKILSSAVLFEVTAVVHARRVRFGIIGAVATAEPFRGLGLSSRLLTEIETLAVSKNLDALILWSDQNQFYSRLGFLPLGMQEIYDLAEYDPGPWVSGSFEPGWDWKAVRELYEKHPCRVERTESYWAQLAKISSCKKFQWVDDQGEVKAYLAFGRGKDLQGIVHEWGGEPEALKSLLGAVLNLYSDLKWLTHPGLADPVRDLLGVQNLIVSSNLALIKPLKPGMTFNQVWFWGLDSL